MRLNGKSESFFFFKMQDGPNLARGGKEWKKAI